jgi:subtilisin family serine protease
MINATVDTSHAVQSGEPGVTVGIIGTGIDGSHPDLAPNFNSVSIVERLPGVPGRRAQRTPVRAGPAKAVQLTARHHGRLEVRLRGRSESLASRPRRLERLSPLVRDVVPGSRRTTHTA